MSEFSIRAVSNGRRCDVIVAGEVDLQVVDALTPLRSPTWQTPTCRTCDSTLVP